MNITIKQVSSLEKIRDGIINTVDEISEKTLMRGEFFSYQIAYSSSEMLEFNVEIESPIKEYIKVYSVKNTLVDFPTYSFADDDYITKNPCFLPDLLLPIEKEKNLIKIASDCGAIWISVNLPRDIAPGTYTITVKLTSTKYSGDAYCQNLTYYRIMKLNVSEKEISTQKTIFSQWFHVDCIADIHNVEIYSEEHWTLIDKYMALASEIGMNMILTPVITPPLDTEVGTMRPCTQLVEIDKNFQTYSFDFTKLKRWVELCKKHNIKYFEISHLFSQWGLSYTPNIKIRENGEETFLFGWNVESRSDEYRNFLNQFLPALINFFKEEGIKENCWFHVSDEPHLEHIDAYKYAFDLIKPLIDGCVTFDALSDFAFYEKGLVDHPITATNYIEPFLEAKVEHQLAYTCCGQYSDVGNRFIAQESFKNRIIGLQMYKYNVEGFLQWGYNFYYSNLSRYLINPYLTTSSGKAFPSGDAFSVYPITDGVAPSLRALVFREALNDIEVCRTLETIIGREKVIELIDKEANMNVTFKEYPRNNHYIIDLIEKMQKIIRENS